MPNNELLKVSIDAMGGDDAPAVPVEGAIQAAKTGLAEVFIVGDREPVEQELAKHDTRDLPIHFVSSKGKIEDDEAPALALRQKPAASILVATNLVNININVTKGSINKPIPRAAHLASLPRPLKALTNFAICKYWDL